MILINLNLSIMLLQYVQLILLLSDLQLILLKLLFFLLFILSLYGDLLFDLIHFNKLFLCLFDLFFNLRFNRFAKESVPLFLFAFEFCGQAFHNISHTLDLDIIRIFRRCPQPSWLYIVFLEEPMVRF